MPTLKPEQWHRHRHEHPAQPLFKPRSKCRCGSTAPLSYVNNGEPDDAEWPLLCGFCADRRLGLVAP